MLPTDLLPKAQQIIDQLSAINYENPSIDERRIREAFSRHLIALNQRDRFVEIYRSLSDAFDVASESTFDAQWDAAFEAAKKVVSDAVFEAAKKASSDAENHFMSEVAMEAANKAIAIDPNVSEAYTSLCDSKFFYELNFGEAERACKRAVELDPNSSLAHMTYSMVLTSSGRFDESLTEIRTAMDLDPVSLRNQRTFANKLYIARRYDEAIEVYRRLVDLNSEVGMTYLWFIRALDQSGRESEAFENLLRLLTVQNKDNETIERFKTAYARSGWPGAVRERINTELQEERPRYQHLAEYYARLGEKDKAFEYLEKALGERAWQLMYLRVDPRFDPLRDDPRFDTFVKRVLGN